MKKATAIICIIGLLFMIGCSANLEEENPPKSVEPSEPAVTDPDSKAETTQIEDLSRYFTGYDGTFVLFDKSLGEYTIYNELKSEKRLPPCSTFKIVNSLIGLETGVIQDENTLYKWDGKKRSVEEWNKDHTLASAIKVSAVWYFQELARNVGAEKMQYYLDKTDYGNKDISGGIDQFWLQSTLEISPMEQVEMLRKLYDYQLPFSKRNIDIVKAILIDSEEDGVVFSGKTGSGGNVNGWFVGYVERGGHVYFFATNIEGEKQVSGAKAKEITKSILKDKKLL